MLGLKKVAVTGNLSSGKSSVCRIFKELGAYVVSADTIVHQLLFSDESLIQKVIQLLGPGIYINKKIEKSLVANCIFKDNKLLTAFEELIHPLVYQKIEAEYENLRLSPIPPPLFVAEIPLLFETRAEKNYEITIAVISNELTCLERFKLKTGYNDAEFNARLSHQLSSVEKAKRADFVIENNGSLEDLEKLTTKLYKKFTT